MTVPAPPRLTEEEHIRVRACVDVTADRVLERQSQLPQEGRIDAVMKSACYVFIRGYHRYKKPV